MLFVEGVCVLRRCVEGVSTVCFVWWLCRVCFVRWLCGEKCVHVCV